MTIQATSQRTVTLEIPPVTAVTAIFGANQSNAPSILDSLCNFSSSNREGESLN
jgi:hypothetical protein